MTRRTFGLIGAATAAALLLQATPVLADPPPHAKAWGYGDRDDYRHYDRDRDCDRGRYYYPHPVYYVPRLPHGYRVVQYRGMPHYYYRGVWYAPYGGRYGVIRPPVGVVIDSRGVRSYVNAEVPIARW
jgi:hypothetical protein